MSVSVGEATVKVLVRFVSISGTVDGLIFQLKSVAVILSVTMPTSLS
jgi:hypothetical protein